MTPVHSSNDTAVQMSQREAPRSCFKAKDESFQLKQRKKNHLPRWLRIDLLSVKLRRRKNELSFSITSQTLKVRIAVQDEDIRKGY